MVAGDDKSLVQVQPVRIVAVMAGIEVNLVALMSSGKVENPVEQSTSVAFAPVFGQGRKVVDVDGFTPGQVFSQAETRNGGCYAVFFNKGQLVATALKTLNFLYEFLFEQVRPQGVQRQPAFANVSFRLGSLDGH